MSSATATLPKYFILENPRPEDGGPTIIGLRNLLGAALCHYYGTDYVAALRFNALAERWKLETGHLSNLAKSFKHPAYREILAMGTSAIPLILNDIRQNGPYHWFDALNALTGENPVPSEHMGDVSKMTEAWMQWGMDHGHL